MTTQTQPLSAVKWIGAVKAPGRPMLSEAVGVIVTPTLALTVYVSLSEPPAYVEALLTQPCCGFSGVYGEANCFSSHQADAIDFATERARGEPMVSEWLTTLVSENTQLSPLEATLDIAHLTDVLLTLTPPTDGSKPQAWETMGVVVETKARQFIEEFRAAL